MSSILNDGELRRFWKDIYFAAVRAGASNFEAVSKADTAVQHLIARGK